MAILTLGALGSLLWYRSSQAAPDLSTPSGVVTAFVQAVQAGQADRAWDLTTQNAAQPAPYPAGPVYTRDEYRVQVHDSLARPSSRIRILSSSQSGNSASVEVEVTNITGNLLTSASSNVMTVALTRQGASWRISSDPSPWLFQ